MSFSFNTSGNLHETIELSFEEFQKHFVTNPARKEKFKNAVTFFRIFCSCGCKAVYIGGSFVSKKKSPDDIDLCFDMTNVDYDKLKRKFPEFFDPGKYHNIGLIRRTLKCHIFTFDSRNTILYDYLEKDRNGFRKGLVKINFQNGCNYD